MKHLDAVTRGVLSKKVVEISKNSQENTCAFSYRTPPVATSEHILNDLLQTGPLWGNTCSESTVNKAERPWTLF